MKSKIEHHVSTLNSISMLNGASEGISLKVEDLYAKRGVKPEAIRSD